MPELSPQEKTMLNAKFLNLILTIRQIDNPIDSLFDNLRDEEKEYLVTKENNKTGKTLLIEALSRKKEHQAIFLINCGSEIYHRDKDDKNSLFYVRKNGWYKVLKIIDEKHDILKDHPNLKKETIYYASESNNSQLISDIIEDGENLFNFYMTSNGRKIHPIDNILFSDIDRNLKIRIVNAIDNFDYHMINSKQKTTPLIFCLRKKEIDLSQIILNKTTILDATDKDGYNAFYYACSNAIDSDLEIGEKDKYFKIAKQILLLSVSKEVAIDTTQASALNKDEVNKIIDDYKKMNTTNRLRESSASTLQSDTKRQRKS